MFKPLPSYMRKNGAHKSIVTCRIKFIVTAVTLSFICICLTLVSCKFNNEVERKWRNTETSFHVKTHYSSQYANSSVREEKYCLCQFIISMMFTAFLDIFQASVCALSNTKHHSIEELDTTGDNKFKKL